MFRTLIAAGAAAAALLTAGQANAAVTFLEAYLEITPHIEVGTPEDATAASEVGLWNDMAQRFTLGDFSVAADTSAHLVVDGQAYGDAVAEQAMAVTFADAANGSFRVDSYANAVSYAEHMVNHGNLTFYGTYAFSLDRASTLDLDFMDGYGTVQVFGDNGQIFATPFGADGSASVKLQAGVYALNIAAPNTIHYRFYGPGQQTFEHHSVLDFSITAGVPEPGAWALMILGFGATGAALRRRRLTCAV